MRLVLTALLLTCILGATAHGTEPLAPASPVRLTNLFNGRDLTGWEYIAATPGDIVQVATVKDGVVSVLGKPNGYLATVETYADYVLHAEWRWSDLTPIRAPTAAFS